MSVLVIASSNEGKIVELRQSLTHLTLKSQSDFDCVSPEETGLSFIENALIKARSIAKQTGLPALADDSGLMIRALSDRPGVFSARFAGVGATDEDNVTKVLSLLGDHPDRFAQFCCVLALVRSPEDPLPIIAEGTWEGQIHDFPQGEHGFGYDPIFYLPEQGCTAAELRLSDKAKLSHRAKALAILKTRMAVEFSP